MPRLNAQKAAYNLGVHARKELPRILLVLSLLCVSSESRVPQAKAKPVRRWERVLQGQQEATDVPSSHSLQYFTADPFLRDDGNEFCVACTASGKSQVHKQHRFKAELSEIGTTHGFPVYNLLYFFDDDIESGKADWKSILVRVPGGQFYEIYHLQATGIDMDTAYFMDARSSVDKRAVEILATSDVMPGTGFRSYEAYWWFDKDGPVRIDTDGAVEAALTEMLPAGTDIQTGGGLNMETLTYRNSVWKVGDAHCCPSGGGVDIQFKLDKGVLSVIHQQFKPD